MQDRIPDPLKPEASPSATGSWPAGPSPEGAGTGSDLSADETPTVRRGPSGGSGSGLAHVSGSGSGSGLAMGSGSRLVVGSGSGGGLGRGPMEVGLPSNGDRLDSFEIQQAIGVGGMGAVFRALDVRLDRFVALKVLPPGQSHEAENVRRFYQEGRAAARLDHENIARVFTIGQDKSLHYIAFEYIDGTTIRQRVEQRGPLPVAEAINFTLQIAGALVHASERGVVHRDIKPSNIIVTPHGRAKLVDMGLARRFEREGADEGLTQSNMTLGTFDYISPEQARDPRSVDVRSDLYSLGCTIYHMLTGQPPFPGGTVLQKLLSHREEPAPDVRVLNPAVPSDLATIVLKLMAKDPDRRYQTPEQLVRDLLTLAGALGLRSISPEGLVWMNAAPKAPGWERHLFWGLPAAVLLLVVGALIWVGQEPPGQTNLAMTPDELIDSVASSSLSSPPSPSPPPVGGEGDGSSAPPAGPDGSAQGSGSAPAPDRSPSAVPTRPDEATGPARPAGETRERRVRSDEDLRTVLRSEPPGSTIVLADDGPYRLAPAGEGDAPIRAEVTIRAADGARPVVEAAATNGYSSAARPLLHFAGGRVTIEGLTFQLGSGTASTGPAIQAEGTALTLSRCTFRGSGQPAALELIGPSPAALNSGDPVPAAMPVVLETCTVAGGTVGISSRGLMTLGLRDCLVAARGPAVWFNNAPPSPNAFSFDFGTEVEPAPQAGQPVPARLMLDHVSMLAGADPILRFAATSARVEVSDSLFAPTQTLDRFAAGPPTLVAIDDPDRLHWMGFGNLYARIGIFLWPTGDPKGRPRVFEFETWARGASTAEARSRFTTEHVWAESDPVASLMRGMSASQAFRPTVAGVFPADRTRPGPGSTLVGARRSVSGAIEPIVPAGGDPATATTTAQPPANAVANPARITGFDTDPMTPGPMVLMPEAPDEPPRVATAPRSRPRPSEPVEGEAPPIVFPLFGPPEGPAPDAADRAEAARAADVPRPSLPVDPGREDEADEPARSDEAGEPVIRTGSQFLGRLGRLGPKGGVLRLASDARIDLPGRALSGSGIVEIVAEPGPGRPVLRLRAAEPGAADADGWSFLLRVVPQAELQLRGIDLVLDGESVVGSDQGPRAAFGLDPDATLELVDCSVTIAGPADGAAVVRLLADRRPESPMDPGFSRMPGILPSPKEGRSFPANLRMVDSLIRSAGDLVDVAPEAQLDELQLSNVVASCGGSLVAGHGRSAGPGLGSGSGPGADAPAEARLVVSLRRATVVARGGIVRLSSSADQPALPRVELTARQSILATGPDGGALFRVEGQGELDDLSDRIRIVESREVAYHRIDEYRRDQTAQPGTLPVVLDRDEWALSLGRTEADARHGDVGFRSRRGPEADPLTLAPDDVRLDPNGPAANLGPDLNRIPDPPTPATPGNTPRSPSAEVIERLRRAFPGFP
ncbi:protein kinase [Tautonia sp. JC769]|uniref:serine/threonine-protein kinase n=1 Tax=Tautonia sp. JC769 TaxID=3232135 RepID=UPI0034582C65